MTLTGPDLVSAGYPISNPSLALLGATAQVGQSNLPARSNLEWLGAGTLTDGALAATQVALAVAIPATPGDSFSKVDLLIGATAASTPTHQYAALYSGIAVPALLAQSVDGTTAPVAASGRYTFTLASQVEVTETNCPYGYIYASVLFVASSIPTAAGISTPTAVGYRWYSNGPLFLGASHGSGLGATAPGTIASPSAVAVTPVVVLR